MAPRKRVIGDDEPGPAEAKKRIAKNQRTHNKTLDLSDCGLETVPAEVAELVWLESLDLGGNQQLSNLAPLASLGNLRAL